MYSKLVIDHATQTCALRERPRRSARGRRTHLSHTEIRHGRYLYWTGRCTASFLAVRWGVTRRAAAFICSFRRLAYVWSRRNARIVNCPVCYDNRINFAPIISLFCEVSPVRAGALGSENKLPTWFESTVRNSV